MIGTTHACSLLGTVAVPVTVEVHVERGLPRCTIVGLREADARECRERVRCGLLAIGIDFPVSRITINLAPADLPKAGAAFDLPIALALLVAMGKLPAERVAAIASQGELGLDGAIRPVLGTMAGALCAARAGWSEFLVAEPSALRASHASIPVRGATTLAEIVDHLRGARPLPEQVPDDAAAGSFAVHRGDLADVRGQQLAVEATVVAAAGRHSLLLSGPPGCGKTMLTSRMPTVLPALAGDEALEVATVHDAAGLAVGGISRERPFREPHHSLSVQAMVGGGSGRPVVGELSLAHHGVLFLDELPEYRPSVLDALRQPLEDQRVTIRRARWVVTYPAETQLVAAMNLCRCGRYGAPTGEPCACTEQARLAYVGRVSGAILDRFDIRLRLAPLDGAVTDHPSTMTSDEARAIVDRARARQAARCGAGATNGTLRTTDAPGLELDPACQRRLQQLATVGALSARSQRAVIRVARTMADIDDRDVIDQHHLVRAFQLCRGSDERGGARE